MSAETTKKDRRWLLPDSRNELKPGLYMVATPIGNLGDITLRALDVLSAADLVVCEDTRVSGKLMAHFGIEKPLWPYNDHNAARQRGPILEKLTKGERVAFISDAGTPLISDPGYKLAQDCIAAGIYISAIPGACAPVMALQLSGLPSDQFCFIGFLPPKSGARKKILTEWAGAQATVLAFETAPRLLDALEDIRDVLGERDVAVARELTKLYEDVRRGPVSELIEAYKKEKEPKGEIVLAIGSVPAQAMSEKDVRAALKKNLKTMGTSEAAAALMSETGWPRKKLYELALELGKK